MESKQGIKLVYELAWKIWIQDLTCFLSVWPKDKTVAGRSKCSFVLKVLLLVLLMFSFILVRAEENMAIIILPACQL